MAQGMIEMVLGPRQIEPLNFSETLIIGRDPAACHIALEDHRISAVHCRIELQRGVFTLVDLGSANNTFLNGEKVSRQALKSGDLIKLGNFVLLFNQMEGTAPKLPGPAPVEDATPVNRTIAGPRRPTGGTGKVAEAEAAAAAPVAPGKSFGRFEVKGEIGRGGMGVIYKVVDAKSKTNREYALKALPGGSFAGREVVERFMDEARALSRIKQDGVVRIYKIDEEGGTPYYVMDFIDGVTLEKKIETGMTFTPDEALIAVRQIAEIIGGVHQTGLIHRDLTPNNVIYERGSNKTWIVDFGLAKDLMVRERLTRTGELVGTPHYVSPEQAEGDLKAVDRRTDIYAMGAILYRMLTGRVPFDGESVPQIVMKVLLEDVKPPRQIHKEIPLKVEAICLCALAKDKEQRYASAEALIADIDRYFRGEPIEARQLTLATQVSKAAWKVRLALALLAVLVAFVLTITGGYASRIHAIRSFKQEKLALFLQGGEKLVAVCAAPESTTIQGERAAWNEWQARFNAACEAVGEHGVSDRWQFSQSLAPATDSIARLKRLRDATALFLAATDLDPGNTRAEEGLRRVGALIQASGEAELKAANDFLARERTEGAIFHAQRALDHAPQLSEPVVRAAREMVTNARRSTQISAPDAQGAPQSLPVRIFPAAAPELGAGDAPVSTPVATRKAGPLIFCVGPAGDTFWFALELDKSITSLEVHYRPRPASLPSAYRLMGLEKRGEARWAVVQAGYLVPHPISQETLTLVGERTGKALDLGTDPRSPGLVAPGDALGLCEAMGVALPTRADLEQWLRFARPAAPPARVLALDGGAVAAFDVVPGHSAGGRLGDATLAAPAKPGPGAILPVVAAARVDAQVVLQTDLDAQRGAFRQARADMVETYESAITRVVDALAAGDPAKARAQVDALLAGLGAAAPFKVLEKTRAEMQGLARLLLSGLAGEDAPLQRWLGALAAGDQAAILELSSDVSAHLERLQQLFVNHEGRWYPSKQKAQEAGALYFDESSGRWLTPKLAVAQGFVFAGGTWQRATAAAELGLGTLVERDGQPLWIDRASALAEGYAYWQAQKQWRTLAELWSATPTVTALPGEAKAARLAADDSVVLLGVVKEGTGEAYFLTRHATPGAEPLWKVKLKTTARSTPRDVLCAQGTIAVRYPEEVRIYGTEKGDALKRIEKLATGETIALAPTGKELAIGRGNGTVDFYDLGSELIRTWSSGRVKPIKTIAYAPDGIGVVVGYKSGEVVRIVNRDLAGTAYEPKLGGEINGLVQLSPTLDKEVRIAALGDATEIWFHRRGEEVKPTGHSGRPIALSALRGNRYMLSTGRDSKLLVWAVDPPAIVAKISSPEVKIAQDWAEMSSTGDWILSIGTDYVVRVWSPP